MHLNKGYPEKEKHRFVTIVKHLIVHLPKVSLVWEFNQY